LAEESNTDFLITGNTNDFIMTNFKGAKIVNPKDYWKIFRNDKSIMKILVYGAGIIGSTYGFTF